MGWVLLILFGVGSLAFCAYSLLKLIGAIKERKNRKEMPSDDNGLGKEE